MDQKTLGMEPAQFPQETHTPAQLSQRGKGLLIFSLDLSTFSLGSQFHIPTPPNSPPGSNSLVTFPRVLRVVCKHSQSWTRMNHFSLTASSHRASAPDSWGSCGCSAELTLKLDAVLWMHPNDGWDEGQKHFHQLLAVLLNVQHRIFLTFSAARS